MDFKKTKDENNRNNWSRDILFISIALIVAGREIERRELEKRNDGTSKLN